MAASAATTSRTRAAGHLCRTTTTAGLPIPNALNVPPPTTFDNASPTTTGPTYTSVAAAQDALGNWKPGIYNGFAPSGGKMNGGVYKIINASSLTLSAITNTVHATSGTSN